MGREIKRVPLDFDWPLDKVWEGFLMPDSLRGEDCPECYGGQTHAGWWLQHWCQRLEMMGADVGHNEQGKEMHPWLAQDPYPHTNSRSLFEPATRVIRPSADMATLVAGLIDSTEDKVKSGWGGSSYVLYRKLVEAAGLDDWGLCERCDAEGTLETYPGQRADAEAWESEEPPGGEGWQLWETVSEGSPISPVFATDEELAQWLTTPDACWGAMKTPMTIDQARGFVGVGWAPSMMANAGGIHDGATYVGTKEALGAHEEAEGES